MRRPCEVCAGLEKVGVVPRDKTHVKIRSVLVGRRIVSLCDAHARELRASGADDVEQLAALFSEPGGRRSLIGRRAPLDRRVFPPRPEGRRCSAGRRHDDAAE